VRVASLSGKFLVSAKVLFWLWVELKTHAAVSLNKVQNTGLGNQYDLVGRFFMEHPLLISGKLLFSSPAALYTQRNIRVGEVFIGIALGLSKAVQEREQNSNFSARPLPIPDWVEANRLMYRTRKRQRA